MDYTSAAIRLYPDNGHRRTMNATSGMMFEYMSELNADRRLYEALRVCLDGTKGTNGLCDEGRRVGNALVKDFEISGITLNASNRAELTRLQLEIQRLGQQFEEEGSGNAMKNLFQLSKARNDISRMLGFQSYSHLALNDKVLSTPEAVSKFLEKFGTDRFESISQEQRQTSLDLNSSLQLLNSLCKSLFNVKFTVSPSSLYDLGCHRLLFYTVEGGKYLGEVLICHGEAEIACHYPIRTWRSLPSKNIVYNFDGPQTPICIITLCHERKRTLLFYSELQSLFHEFGHSLHTILSESKYHHLSGTRCKLDLAEVPSTLMELILADPQLTGHDFGGGGVESGISRRQVQLANFDLFVHGPRASEWHNLGTFEAALNEWCMTNSKSPTEGRALLAQLKGFKHLVNYGAGYYSYFFCKNVAQKVWQRYFDRSSPRYDPIRFKTGALAHGGTRRTSEILYNLQLSDII
jgi:Zn-dependent oligopeptidase